jgi:molecular chaperone IbpA
MRTVDFTPLHRFTVGFDRMQRQFDQAMRMDDSQASYPPYNIEALDDENYRITMAVAGFSEQNLELTLKEDTLFISGKADNQDQDVHYLHHGIAGRPFERRFELADHIKVVSASLENGMLNINLAREVPEDMKPRTIKIETAAKTKGIENKAA